MASDEKKYIIMVLMIPRRSWEESVVLQFIVKRKRETGHFHQFYDDTQPVWWFVFFIGLFYHGNFLKPQ